MNEFFEFVQAKAAALAPSVEWANVAMAVIAGALTWLALSTALRVARNRLSRVASGTRTRLDDGLVRVLDSTSGMLLMLVGVLVTVGLLPLSDRWHDAVSHLWFAVAVLQVALWAQRAIRLLLQASHDRQRPGEAMSVSTTVLGWALRVVLWLVVVLAVLSNMGVNITAFIASLGIGGIAIALAVQNILGDLFASLAIAVDKPFEVGDAISVGDVNGTVEKVGLKTTRIRSLSGEQVVMSNAEMLNQVVRNFKRLEMRRVVFAFGLTYDATADQLAEVPEMVRGLVEADPKLEFLRAHFKGFGDSSLDFEVVYRVKNNSFDDYMDCQQALNLALMRALAERGLEFAFPTRTIHVVAPAPAVDAKDGEQQPQPQPQPQLLPQPVAPAHG